MFSQLKLKNIYIVFEKKNKKILKYVVIRI